MSMYESPRIRRLKSDLAALEALREESSIFDFRPAGNPPQVYIITFRGNSLARDKGKVILRDYHQVEIKLGATYPRTMPELRWMTPIYHPNISEIGMVCLGAYGTHWVPSLSLDELCSMLWEMARYQNYDVKSPYNRDAALWSAHQTNFRFPIDNRPLRNVRIAQGRIVDEHREEKPLSRPEVVKSVMETEDLIILDESHEIPAPKTPTRNVPPPPPPVDDVVFID